MSHSCNPLESLGENWNAWYEEQILTVPPFHFCSPWMVNILLKSYTAILWPLRNKLKSRKPKLQKLEWKVKSLYPWGSCRVAEAASAAINLDFNGKKKTLLLILATVSLSITIVCWLPVDMWAINCLPCPRSFIRKRQFLLFLALLFPPSRLSEPGSLASEGNWKSNVTLTLLSLPPPSLLAPVHQHSS